MKLSTKLYQNFNENLLSKSISEGLKTEKRKKKNIFTWSQKYIKRVTQKDPW